MKRSTHVAAPLLASAALAMLAGCKQMQMKRCVDEHNVVVDDSFCENQPGQQDNNYYHPPPGMGFFRWYYGGTGTYYPGSIVSGGGYAPAAGYSYATSRGGFGSSFSDGGHGASE
jgi:hypothetical protein